MSKVIKWLMRYRHWAGIGASVLLGAVFVTASLGKLGPQQTGAYMIIFNLPRALLTPTLANYVDEWLPRVEMGLGILLIASIATRFLSLFSGALIVAFIFNNSWEISRGLGDNPCGCFGNNSIFGFLNVTQALYIDIGMLAAVGIILFSYPGNRRTVRPWFLQRGKI